MPRVRHTQRPLVLRPQHRPYVHPPGQASPWTTYDNIDCTRWPLSPLCIHGVCAIGTRTNLFSQHAKPATCAVPRRTLRPSVVPVRPRLSPRTRGFVHYAPGVADSTPCKEWARGERSGGGESSTPKLSQRGFDPRTCGLWAHHASTALLRFIVGLCLSSRSRQPNVQGGGRTLDLRIHPSHSGSQNETCALTN